VVEAVEDHLQITQLDVPVVQVVDHQKRVLQADQLQRVPAFQDKGILEELDNGLHHKDFQVQVEVVRELWVHQDLLQAQAKLLELVEPERFGHSRIHIMLAVVQ
jgi:hypothetical protein